MRLATAALAGVLLALPAPTSAQVKAYTVPISNDRVVLRLVTGAGRTAQVTVLNGGLARVARAGGPILGLTPSLRDGWVELLISVITKDPVTGNEAIRQVARERLERNVSVHVDQGEVSLEVEWLEARPPAPTPPARSSGGCSSCCVICGPDTFCGCVVETECGRCCCPDKCACDWRDAGAMRVSVALPCAVLVGSAAGPR